MTAIFMSLAEMERDPEKERQKLRKNIRKSWQMGGWKMLRRRKNRVPDTAQMIVRYFSIGVMHEQACSFRKRKIYRNGSFFISSTARCTTKPPSSPILI